MSFSDDFVTRSLDALVTLWPDREKRRTQNLGAEPGTPEWHRAYARDQYVTRLRTGLGYGLALPPLWGKDVLEIGCGHGGITCYLATQGVRRAVGIDVNERDLEYGRELAREIETQTKRALPVEFAVMDATFTDYPSASFDIVFADTLFDHVPDPEAVLGECMRLLRPGGILVVPVFSSIHSKWGLHLKNGIKLPWANLVFSEGVIVKVVQKQAEKRPHLREVYPGVSGNPERVRDLRRHRDLNDATYAKIKDMAERVGFEMKQFRLRPTTLGRVVGRVLPAVTSSTVGDVLSTGAGALLVKPER